MTPRGPADGAGGVLLVDKPEGPTSHDVVARARRALETRRIGHTGTLDPFATGLLLLCVGPATRLSEYLVALEKEYVAEARLGATTDSDDRDGEVVETSDGWRALSPASIHEAAAGRVGRQDQRPPAFSAKRLGGERAHRKARRGEVVDLPPVEVTVGALEVLSVELPDVRFRVRCSSGTYVRALARDLGDDLGVGAHLTSLRRTRVGRHRVECAVALEALEDGAFGDAWMTAAEALAHLPQVEVDAASARRLAMGQRLPLGPLGLTEGAPVDGEPVSVVRGRELVAVGIPQGGEIRPRKVFARP